MNNYDLYKIMFINVRRGRVKNALSCVIIFTMFRYSIFTFMHGDALYCTP